VTHPSYSATTHPHHITMSDANVMLFLAEVNTLSRKEDTQVTNLIPIVVLLKID
jgi:hypothetical protein